jgi:hypothetical protein
VRISHEGIAPFRRAELLFAVYSVNNAYGEPQIRLVFFKT